MTAVAGLPGQDAVLAGFESGTILISALDPIAESRLIRHRGGAAITQLAVTAGSSWLLATAEDGWALWSPLPARF